MRKKIQNHARKIGKLIASRLLYFMLGLLLAVTVVVVYAQTEAWNEAVINGWTLTAMRWNNLIGHIQATDANVTNLQGRVTTLETRLNSFNCTLGAITWMGRSSCPAGQVATDFQWRGSGDNHINNVGCRPIICN